MSKVLRSVKPYWFYLICEGIKTVEVGKSDPKSKDWNREVELYCSKDTKSFNRIPEEFREKYKKYLGKVGAKFVCDKTDIINIPSYDLDNKCKQACLLVTEILDYLETPNAGRYDNKPCYAWHISDLKIYDTPKEIEELKRYCHNICSNCAERYFGCKGKHLTRAPQSWVYVEEL